MTRLLLACALALVPLTARADEPKPKRPPAADRLADGLAAAKKGGKAPFLVPQLSSSHAWGVRFGW